MPGPDSWLIPLGFHVGPNPLRPQKTEWYGRGGDASEFDAGSSFLLEAVTAVRRHADLTELLDALCVDAVVVDNFIDAFTSGRYLLAVQGTPAQRIDALAGYRLVAETRPDDVHRWADGATGARHLAATSRFKPGRRVQVRSAFVYVLEATNAGHEGGSLDIPQAIQAYLDTDGQVTPEEAYLLFFDDLDQWVRARCGFVQALP